jgi:hypothetical protein
MDTNELSILEFIHTFVETLDMYFGNVVCRSVVRWIGMLNSILTHWLPIVGVSDGLCWID